MSSIDIDIPLFNRYLERGVEQLSGLIESSSSFSPTTIWSWFQNISDKTTFVRDRNEITLNDTAKGFREGRWEWDEALIDASEDD